MYYCVWCIMYIYIGHTLWTSPILFTFLRSCRVYVANQGCMHRGCVQYKFSLLYIHNAPHAIVHRLLKTIIFSSKIYTYVICQA